MKMSSHGYKLIVIVVTALLLATFISACADKDKHEHPVQYQCPMHPTYISDKPGSCPICGMDLVPIEKSKSESSEKSAVTSPSTKQAAVPGKYIAEKTAEPEKNKIEQPLSGERKILLYRNPTDPSISSPVPAKNELGMDYVPIYSSEIPTPDKGVKGLATVTIDEKGIRLAGIQVAEAVKQKLEGDIRAVGLVKPDETRVRHVHTKNSGWIEKLYVNTTGQLVRAGQPLLTIYSPQLLGSQEEFLRARENAMRFANSSIPEVQKGGEDLLKAARRRLELFDVPESLIKEIERTGLPKRTVTLLAPVSGFVTAKGVYEGQQVEPGMELFTITDLSKIWIEADFYEFEAHLIRLGQKAVFTFPYDPKAEKTGRISYIYPYLDPQSRTLRARFEFQNSDFSLKPEMYVNVSMKIETSDSVVVPDSSVMNTGLRQIVFVSIGEDRFEPREVKVGYRSSGMAQVISGVGAGEKVVVRANFLLDSESRVRAAIMQAAGAGGGK
ncbi:MAG: efflux RND transporter periplasmic adaptor subunit [Pseudomonadota bacterium]|nr:efflux RND transporter periplasmic adaptor subunit [Pseudomonadota bacterium]MBU1570106.1 efflux RND transporter periplasmic adaptor subunit [Pseudomonadota bacterium]